MPVAAPKSLPPRPLTRGRRDVNVSAWFEAARVRGHAGYSLGGRPGKQGKGAQWRAPGPGKTRPAAQEEKTVLCSRLIRRMLAFRGF
jgi:hypothetical protein